MCGRGGSRRLLAKDHPGRAEPIRDHAEAFGKEGLSHRHAHRPALGEGVKDALRLGGRIDADGQEKPFG